MTLAYFVAEVRRSYRNRRTLVFTLGIPVLIFVVFYQSAKKGGNLGGVTGIEYLMVSWAAYGALTAVLAAGGRIAVERQSGWARQLRLTPLPGYSYLIGKCLAGFAVAVLPLLAIFGLGAAFGVHLTVGKWLTIAFVIIVTLIPIAVFGIFLGYSIRADSLQAAMGGTTILLALVGGIFIPIQDFPKSFVNIAELTPSYWSNKAGRLAIQGDWLGIHGIAVLVFWAVALGALAIRAYSVNNARQ